MPTRVYLRTDEDGPFAILLDSPFDHDHQRVECYTTHNGWSGCYLNRTLANSQPLTGPDADELLAELQSVSDSGIQYTVCNP